MNYFWNTWYIANEDKSKQIQHERIEAIRSSRRRGLCVERVRHFFVGGSWRSSKFDVELSVEIKRGVSVIFSIEKKTNSIWFISSVSRNKNLSDQKRRSLIWRSSKNYYFHNFQKFFFLIFFLNKFLSKFFGFLSYAEPIRHPIGQQK